MGGCERAVPNQRRSFDDSHLTLECTPELIPKARRMSECCAAPTSDALAMVCPSCRNRGSSVDFRTVKALLTESALRCVAELSHRFCRTPECDTVYYDEAGTSYQRSDVRARVWQKEPACDRPKCYCFGETEATIRQEVLSAGRSDAVERVKAHIEGNRCACDVRNPRGVCCLGDLTLAVERVKAEHISTGMAP